MSIFDKYPKIKKNIPLLAACFGVVALGGGAVALIESSANTPDQEAEAPGAVTATTEPYIIVGDVTFHPDGTATRTNLQSAYATTEYACPANGPHLEVTAGYPRTLTGIQFEENSPICADGLVTPEDFQLIPQE